MPAFCSAQPQRSIFRAEPQHIRYAHLKGLMFETTARQGEMAVIENRVTSDDSKLIKDRAASLDGSAGRPVPERDDANEGAAFSQARPWLFPAVPGTYSNSYRAGDE